MKQKSLQVTKTKNSRIQQTTHWINRPKQAIHKSKIHYTENYDLSNKKPTKIWIWKVSCSCFSNDTQSVAYAIYKKIVSFCTQEYLYDNLHSNSNSHHLPVWLSCECRQPLTLSYLGYLLFFGKIDFKLILVENITNHENQLLLHRTSIVFRLQVVLV